MKLFRLTRLRLTLLAAGLAVALAVPAIMMMSTPAYACSYDGGGGMAAMHDQMASFGDFMRGLFGL